MKIIFTVNTYYPLTDGVQAVTEYEAEGLAKLGHDVTVITVRYPGLKELETFNNVKIIRHNIATKHALFVGDIKGYRKRVENLCTDADVLINVCTQTATTEVLYPLLNKLSCKKILYMHGFHDFHWHMFDLSSISNFGHKLWNNIRWRYDYIANGRYLKQYDKVIQLHEMDEANLFMQKKFGIYSEIFNNGADDQFFDFGVNNNPFKKPYAICVSNYIPRKNQEFILRAFYKSKQRDMLLVLIGSSNTAYSSKLFKLKQKLDDEYGKRDVKILCSVPRQKIADYVKNSSLYLLGSKWEAFPISLVEAMAAGKPYLSTDVGIVKYLPGGKIVENIDDMAFWIDLLMSNKKIAKTLGNEGRYYAEENFLEDNIVLRLNKLLKEMNL
ncbi:glycosyltransferase family 4 protein [Limosilactobacillus reuteri]|uniref:glycosyltransferase family 4 protein n=1 Tax=Limosilactobacillus reuteri TaxID=1598 RepID=UPI0013E92483|nr:glycosyltransferase family 4 protein [Limosilactobacillus reuteri]QWS03271.1 glycosyltransferase family 4 protein [Limosilactobacillus reuteri]